MLIDHGEGQPDDLPTAVRFRFLRARPRRQSVAWPDLTEEAHPERHNSSVTDEIGDEASGCAHCEHAVREHGRISSDPRGIHLVDMLG
ncbi:MAG TPA: hypothetical protein VH307_16630 [Streptosporangiaceae bacterium]|nr:hypothetical protein [Streptosporangiaceae bacterium]